MEAESFMPCGDNHVVGASYAAANAAVAAMAAARARFATDRRTPTMLMPMVEMSAVVTVCSSKMTEAAASTATAARLPMVSRVRGSRVVAAVAAVVARTVPVRRAAPAADWSG